MHQSYKNKQDIVNTVLTNTIKMLTARTILDEADIDKNIRTITSKHPDDLVYKIKSKAGLVAILVLLQKITAVTKTHSINDFLNTYENNHKIIIVKSINKKAQQYIVNNYSNAEIFLEEDLLINLIDHVAVPEHQLLTKEEAEEVYKAYNLKRKNMPRIYHSDPVARYYNMKPGNVCRIIRPSMASGLGVTYRYVVKAISKK